MKKLFNYLAVTIYMVFAYLFAHLCAIRLIIPGDYGISFDIALVLLCALLYGINYLVLRYGAKKQILARAVLIFHCVIDGILYIPQFIVAVISFAATLPWMVLRDQNRPDSILLLVIVYVAALSARAVWTKIFWEKTRKTEAGSA